MTEADAIVLLRDTFLLLAFLAAAVSLTWAMFATRQMMLGFPSAIFWAVLGGYAYQESAATWDIYYLLFFAAMGMAIFSMFAAYGLRTKKEELETGDEFIDEGKDDLEFIDEGRSSEGDRQDQEPGGEQLSSRAHAIRDRARRRREAIRRGRSR